jgi:hypothetical protein
MPADVVSLKLSKLIDAEASGAGRAGSIEGSELPEPAHAEEVNIAAEADCRRSSQVLAMELAAEFVRSRLSAYGACHGPFHEG